MTVSDRGDLSILTRTFKLYCLPAKLPRSMRDSTREGLHEGFGIMTSSGDSLF